MTQVQTVAEKTEELGCGTNKGKGAQLLKGCACSFLVVLEKIVGCVL